MSSSGKKLVSAANKKDVRGAKDALSNAMDAVEKALERADDMRIQAETYEEKAAAAAPAAERKAKQVSAAADEMMKGAVKRSVVFDAQGSRILERSALYDQRANNLNQQADAYDAQADSADTPVRKEQLRELATNLRTEAQSSLDQSREEQKTYMTLEKDKQTFAQSTDQRMQEYEARIKDIFDSAEEAAQTWARRAQDLLDGANDLSTSVGGGTSNPTLANKAWKRIKQIFGTKAGISVVGKPLPTWTDDVVVIEPTDVHNAVKGWDSDTALPEETKGLLEARPATLSELLAAAAEMKE